MVRGHGMLHVAAAMTMLATGGSLTPVEEAPRPRRKPDPQPHDDQPETPEAEMVTPEPREPYEMPEGMPDHLSISYRSPHFHEGVSELIGVEIDGVAVSNCYEYCVSGGWYRVRQGMGVSDKMFSKDIRPFWRKQPSRQVLRRLKRR